MIQFKKTTITRRAFVKSAVAASVGISAFPYLNCGKRGVIKPMKRTFAKLDFEVTTLGLGGQASLQWTPQDVDPVPIILKAFQNGINYFDTSNLYGPSQLNFGKAFRALNLIPGNAGYEEKLRRSIFLTTKTHLRWAKGGVADDNVRNWSNGENNTHTIQDVKRSLSQIFGDGKGNYPKGAYVDMVLIHSLSTIQEVDALYRGLENPNADDEHIGALAALRDFRDGTNYTGLNEKEEKLIKHIGFSGHFSPPVMMKMIQRDRTNLLDGLLVAVNANDRLQFNMQHNVLPIAAAKNMGIIAMKVFADGAMYSKEATWSNLPEHVVRSVGSPGLPSRPLVEYSLSMPGVNTAIIGIGQIAENDKDCQLTQNLSAAQLAVNALSESDLLHVEEMTKSVKEGKSNYFQLPAQPLSAPNEIKIKQGNEGGKRNIQLTWNSAYAGIEPITHYEILRDGQNIADVVHKPQTTEDPFSYNDQVADDRRHTYTIRTVDRGGNKAAGEALVAA
jgi:aryl-alcohol dehydrogenase-like predicted oxidoreductase